MPALIAYGVTNLDASPLVAPEDAKELPTDAANMVGAIPSDDAFWVDNLEELTGRFTAWVGQ